MEKNSREDKKERGGRTVWVVDHAKTQDIGKLMGAVPRRTENVADILLCRLGELNMSVEVMAELAGFSRAAGYKILNGKQRAERDMLLRIAFAVGFDYEQTARLLKCGQKQALTGDSARDTAIIYGLVNHLSLGDMDWLLRSLGLVPLVQEKRR